MKEKSVTLRAVVFARVLAHNKTDEDKRDLSCPSNLENDPHHQTHFIFTSTTISSRSTAQLVCFRPLTGLEPHSPRRYYPTQLNQDAFRSRRYSLCRPGGRCSREDDGVGQGQTPGMRRSPLREHMGVITAY